MWGGLLYLAATILVARSAGIGAARLVCYVDGPRQDVSYSECTHLVYGGDARGDKLDGLLKEYRKAHPRVKIVLQVSEGDKDFRTILKSKHIQGLEIHNAHKSLNRTTVLERVAEARTAITTSGGGPLFLAIPAHPELLAKYYDLRALMKKVDFMMLQTHALGAVKKMTYHPSRLSGLWDMMNTDSVVDLAVGLGVPASKLVISLPATALQFTLQNETLSTPGSPAVEDDAKEIGQDELCRQLQKGRWTLERDQDLSAPYAFKDKTWIAFEDASSVDVKGKYARVRGLAGLALHRASRDLETPCGPTLKTSLAKVLNQQSRAPRAAILRSLENEILSAPRNARALDALQVSPYRITQIVDSDGVIHSIREDTRTEFSCSRQGYFVHPRSCARFYRCVKFDQLSPEYTVFEFDCPAGLAFDSRYEVCVWPGSLPDSQACPGSSEIAPVPRTRFICPEHEGYYADPENCRWFFACLDHGKAPLTAYEFRCPFGLGFDADRLKCDWPWVVPACGNIARYEAEVHGFSGAILTGAAGYQGQTADSVNVAAHHSLVSGASLNNLVGIQAGFLNHGDALDSNFITSQEIQGSNQYQDVSGISQGSNGLAYQSGKTNNIGLVQATKYNDGEKYTSGSLILDEYRLPTKTDKVAGSAQIIGANQGASSNGYSSDSTGSNGYDGYSTASLSSNSGQSFQNNYDASLSSNLGQSFQNNYDASLSSNLGQSYQNNYDASLSSNSGKSFQNNYNPSLSSNSGQSYQNNNDADDTGAYVHDPTGDTAEPYKHVGSPVEPYVHQSLGYKDSSEYYDYGRYKGSSEGEYAGKYLEGNSGNSGQYNQDNSGAYIATSSSNKDNSGAYVESGQYNAGAYKGEYSDTSYNNENSGSYRADNSGAFNAENSGAYNAENSGAYNADHSGEYNSGNFGSYRGIVNSNSYRTDFSGSSGYKADNSGEYNAENSGAYFADNSGAYNSGNFGSYRAGIANSNTYRKDYSGSSGYKADNSGAYKADFNAYKIDNSGDYNTGSNLYKTDNSGAYIAGYSGSYNHDNSGQYEAGVYRTDGHIGNGPQSTSSVNLQSYSQANSGNYISDSKAYTGSSHTLTAGAINVGLVGKTTLVDADYNNQNNYQGIGYTQSDAHQTLHPAQVSFVPQPAVSITHVGTDENNLDGYGYVTTPTSSGIPTTATPYEVTTALPAVTYKTTFLPEEPKSSIKQIFGFSQPAVTAVQPTIVAVKQYTPQIQVDYNQGVTQLSSNYNSQKASYNSQSVEAAKTDSGYHYSKPNINFEDGISYSTAAPAVHLSSFKPQSISHSQQTLHNIDSVGFQYSTPTPVNEPPFKKLVAYSTGPSVSSFVEPTVASFPQSYRHQTLHKVESSNVHVPLVQSTGFTYEQPQSVIQYTTAQPALAIQPAVTTYQPQGFSQQTFHQVEAERVNTYSQDTSSGYKYEKPAIKFEDKKTVFEYSTPAPTLVQYSTSTPVVSTYKPQLYSQQTLHKIESRPLVTVSSTPAPIIHYQVQPTPVTTYQNPILEFTQPKVTPITYEKPTFQPQAYSHQTIHKTESKAYTPSVQTGYEYTKPSAFEQPKTVFQYTTPTPVIVSTYQPAVSTYQPQVFSHQTSHKVDTSHVKTYSEAESGYQYPQPVVTFEESPQSILSYSTTSAPVVVSTYKPQSFSHQTIHKAERPKFVASTPIPQVDVGYQTAVAPQVSIYQNPILKYSQKITPLTYVKPTATIFTQTYQPVVLKEEVNHGHFSSQEATQQNHEQNVQLYQGHTYEQPEIQSNTARKAYSDASVVSHQTFHLASDQYDTKNQYDSGKDIVFVSTTPSTLAFEDHYSEYETQKKIETYQAPEYIPPKTEYQQSFSIVSSPAPPVQTFETQELYVKPVEYSQTYETVKTVPAPVSFSTSHVSEPKKVESYHISTFPGTKAIINYKQTFENPEIQVQYKAEDYLPPVVSSEALPVVTSTFRPRTFPTSPKSTYSYTTRGYLPPSTTRKYLPPSTTKNLPPITPREYLPPTTTTREYLPPAEPEYEQRDYLPPVKNTFSYLPPSTTARTIYNVKSTTPSYHYTESTTKYKAHEYLPPVEQTSNVINFESFGFDNLEATAVPQIRYNPYQEVRVTEEVTARPLQRKPNIVVETAKSNLLGFGTVGPDAGLVSPVTYTTALPIIVSSTARPIIKSTTEAPYKYVQSTTYKAPEYLPPVDEEVSFQNYGTKNADQVSRGKYKYEDTAVISTYTPQRKQNIVVQTAKANQGYNSVVSDAGLVSQTSYTPAIVSSSETYTVAPKRPTTAYASEEQGLFEVTQAPRRRNKQKVAVVTKINDFNPLLVRKLGAVCSCQSPVLVLRGTRPNTPIPTDYEDYSNDYEDSRRGDISDDEWAQKSARIQTQRVTAAPVVTSTFNPIIVPDDSYYQDYQEPSDFEIAVTPKNEEIFVSSTPLVPSTQRVVRIRPRVKDVTAAPTYRTVLQNHEVSSTVASQTVNSELESQSFDRYGPGGWRSRDETLQGSVDCKRAGLFRHPKQCNKFYACRWDCTKQRFTLHVFNCPVQLSFDPSLGACNWPSQGPACQGDTLLTNTL